MVTDLDGDPPSVPLTWSVAKLATILDWDRRTVVDWLTKNGVPVHNHSGRRRYVALSDLVRLVPWFGDSLHVAKLVEQSRTESNSPPEG